MILKVMRILLIFSLAMLSLMAVAEAEITNSEQENKTTSTDNTPRVQGNEQIKKILYSKKTAAQIDDSIVSPVDTTKASGESVTPQSPPRVGKNVMANMNPGSMILSLLLVLGLIVICALVLKRFNLTQQGVSQLKVISTLRLGTKERLIVVEVGEQQLLLGVTSQQISLLDTLSEPLITHSAKSSDLPKNILSFLSSKQSKQGNS